MATDRQLATVIGNDIGDVLAAWRPDIEAEGVSEDIADVLHSALSRFSGGSDRAHVRILRAVEQMAREEIRSV